MFYCAKCLRLSDTDTCDNCGRRKLKAPSPTDFCFLTETSGMFADMLKEALRENKIPCTEQSSDAISSSLFGVSQNFSRQRLFVPYEYLEHANEIATALFENQNEDLTEEDLTELHYDDDFDPADKETLD